MIFSTLEDHQFLTFHQLFKRGKTKHDSAVDQPAESPRSHEKPLSETQLPLHSQSSDSGMGLDSPCMARPELQSPPEVLCLKYLPNSSFEELCTHLREREQYYRPSPDYLTRHPEMRPRMRAVLLDWLIEVFYLLKFWLF